MCGENYTCAYVYEHAISSDLVCSIAVDEYILSMEKNLEVLMKETPSLKPEEVEKLGNKTYDVYPNVYTRVIPACLSVCFTLELSHQILSPAPRSCLACTGAYRIQTLYC